MYWYTQLIFVKKGHEDTFNAFEGHVLPLLNRHNGQLLYRVRPGEDSVIETGLGHPYEIHLVTFEERKDFEAYRDDPERKRYLHLKDQSIEKALLVEGKLM